MTSLILLGPYLKWSCNVRSDLPILGTCSWQRYPIPVSAQQDPNKYAIFQLLRCFLEMLASVNFILGLTAVWCPGGFMEVFYSFALSYSLSIVVKDVLHRPVSVCWIWGTRNSHIPGFNGHPHLIFESCVGEIAISVPDASQGNLQDHSQNSNSKSWALSMIRRGLERFFKRWYKRRTRDVNTIR